MAIGTGDSKRANSALYWGIQFDLVDSVTEPNASTLSNKSMKSYSKYFPMFHPTNRNFMVGDNAGVADSAGTVLARW